jgi:hypothetical protein
MVSEEKEKGAATIDCPFERRERPPHRQRLLFDGLRRK